MRVLLEVAAQGSISAAAESLNYTPSAISQQIATLEREAGVALVGRRAPAGPLTPPGRARRGPWGGGAVSVSPPPAAASSSTRR